MVDWLIVCLFVILFFYRNSLTEICVLSDILNVVQDKKYMVLDPVTQNQATPKPTVQLLAKRKVWKSYKTYAYNIMCLQNHNNPTE